MSEWKTYKLGELPIQFIDGDRGKNYPKGEDFSKVGHCLFLNAGNVTKNGWDFSGNMYISKEKDNLLRNGKLERGDIVLTTRGTIGNVVLYSNDIPYKHIRINSGMVIIRNNNTCYNPYLYQYLRSYSFLGQVQQFQSGSAQPQIPISTLKKITVSLPPLETQKRIADILSAIDDKIELNRRINANLEQQAQALYKSWFVDNKKDDWKEVPLSEVADFVGGYSYKGNELVESSMTAMATIKNFERKGGFKVDGFKDIVASNKLKAEHHANLFDILVAHTDLTQNADVIGNAEMLLTFDKYSDIIFSMDLVKVLPKQTFPYKYLLAALLKNPHFKKHCMGYVNGTTVLHMSKKALPEYVINLPSAEEIQSMDNAFKAYYLKMAEILQENNSLSTLRDTLLPKLMSGEITV